uniref:zinc finger translocation-associated protein isoform X3 n=1 Tax=Scatophagus argus TaxID=75038 RepID=UPI001ED83B43|nr:zinc finger translocation-associated protein isoform X3 [Scatophagus argus]
MEEKETGESEPVDLRCAEQAELLSLIISGEEEATQEESDLGEEDGLANGHGEEESEAGMVTPVRSPGTSYWSITEGPDHPLLLSPAPGPSGRKPRVQRASRPGLSRIPGRDHRRYYHEYWRSEYLMDFDPQRHGMICMVCGSSLATLKLSTIKRHIRQKHPDSLLWSAADKEVIRSGWESHLSLGGGQRSYSSTARPSPQEEEERLDSDQHAAEEPENSIKSEPNTKEAGMDLFAQDVETIQLNTDLYPEGDGTLTQDTCLIGEDGGVGAPQQGPQPLRQPRKRRLRGGDPWRLRLDYLVAYGPQGQGTYCMVCSQVLHESKVSSFRRHIQECHPETTTLSRQEREAMAAAWTKDYSSEGTQIQDEVHLSRADILNTTGKTNEDASPDVRAPSKIVKKDESGSGFKGKARDGGAAATPSRHGHYPGKDQRRNYQVRWRMEYLMDYDCRRHGLICMVCGATLATLKVSTIKRHIQQVHPHSLDYSPEEKQQALLSYNQTALHFIHSDDCFSSQDHGHTELAPTPAHFGT